MMTKMSSYEEVMRILSLEADEINRALQSVKFAPDSAKARVLEQIAQKWTNIYNTLDWKAEQDREKRLNFLMSYLNQLTLLHQSGVHLFEEIDAITKEINRELGLDYKQKGA